MGEQETLARGFEKLARADTFLIIALWFLLLTLFALSTSWVKRGTEFESLSAISALLFFLLLIVFTFASIGIGLWGVLIINRAHMGQLQLLFAALLHLLGIFFLPARMIASFLLTLPFLENRTRKKWYSALILFALGTGGFLLSYYFTTETQFGPGWGIYPTITDFLPFVFLSLLMTCVIMAAVIIQRSICIDIASHMREEDQEEELVLS